MNIREQTPSRRRLAKEEKRIDPKSPEIRRGAKTAQGYRIKKKKKGISKTAVAYTVLFLLIFAVLSSVTALIFWANLTKKDGLEFSRIKLVMGAAHEEEEIEQIRLDAETYFQNGILYVDMTSVAQEFGFITTGDHRELRYVTDEKLGENVRFLLGTSSAEVNGVPIRLDAAVEKKGEIVLVPLSFIEEYMIGLDTEFDEEEAILKILRPTERNEYGNFENKEITFTLKEASPSASLPENELTDEEKNKTYFFDITNMPTEPSGDVG